MISDTLELLRPKIKLCNSLEEAVRQVQDLEREFLIKLGKEMCKGIAAVLTIPVFLKIIFRMMLMVTIVLVMLGSFNSHDGNVFVTSHFSDHRDRIESP